MASDNSATKRTVDSSLFSAAAEDGQQGLQDLEKGQIRKLQAYEAEVSSEQQKKNIKAEIAVGLTMTSESDVKAWDDIKEIARGSTCTEAASASLRGGGNESQAQIREESMTITSDPRITSDDTSLDFVATIPISRGTTTRTSLVIPGAYAHEGPGVGHYYEGNGSGEATTTTSSTNVLQAHDGQLAVANLVAEEDLPTALPHITVAQEGGEMEQGNSQQRQDRKRTRQCIIFNVLGAILIFVSVLVLVSVVVLSSKEEQQQQQQQQQDISEAEHALPITASPSPPPTSIDAHILSLLPVETTIHITTEETSPQAKAYKWLLEGGVNLSFFFNAHIIQKFVMATLHYAMDGNGWINNEHWLNHSVHECDWATKDDFALTNSLSTLYTGYMEGFFNDSEPLPDSCDSNGIYQHLWLDQNNLAGTLPEELYLLTNLKTLSIGYNNHQIQGTISSSHIGRMTSLEGLVISFLMDAGPIPSELGLLTKLRVLGLSANNHKGTIPSEIWRLSNLDTLLLSMNPLHGQLPPDLGNLPKLRWLIMDDCGLTGSIPTQIGHATSMEYLALLGNNLSGSLPKELGQLTELQLLSLFENSIEGKIPTQLGALQSLFLLALRDNLLSGPVPSELGRLTNMTITLSVQNNELSGSIPSELGLLTGLREFDFSDNNFSGQIPSEFGQVSSMGHLSFVNNSLSGTVPQELAELQPTLHTLRLQGNPNLSGTLPAEMCNLTATCFGDAHDACEPPFGLSFDCSELLCGCGCTCM